VWEKAEHKRKGAGKSGAQVERTWLQLMSCTLICTWCPISELENRAEHVRKRKKVSVVDILAREAYWKCQVYILSTVDMLRC
jgi:hypothetical protein